MASKEATKLQQGDRIVAVNGEPLPAVAVVRRVELHAERTTGHPTWSVYREPDGRHELTLYAPDEIQVADIAADGG